MPITHWKKSQTLTAVGSETLLFGALI